MYFGSYLYTQHTMRYSCLKDYHNLAHDCYCATSHYHNILAKAKEIRTHHN